MVPSVPCQTPTKSPLSSQLDHQQICAHNHPVLGSGIIASGPVYLGKMTRFHECCVLMLNIPELTPRTRQLMSELFESDSYISKQLTDAGCAQYREIVARQLADGTVDSMLAEVKRIPQHCLKPNKKGVIAVDVLERLVYTDYLGLYNCAKARELLEAGETHAIIERLGDAEDGNQECTQLEGLAVPLSKMKDCFRARYHPSWNPTAFMLPTVPNCHHGIRQLTEKEKDSPFDDVQIRDIVYHRFRA
jgi:hypothetical protein